MRASWIAPARIALPRGQVKQEHAREVKRAFLGDDNVLVKREHEELLYSVPDDREAPLVHNRKRNRAHEGDNSIPKTVVRVYDELPIIGGVARLHRARRG